MASGLHCLHASTISFPFYLIQLEQPADAAARVDERGTIRETDFSEISAASKVDSTKEKIASLTEMICRAGDEAETKSAALLVLMATLENATYPKAIANTAKRLAFTRCGELNLHGMVDAQIAALESQLFS